MCSMNPIIIFIAASSSVIDSSSSISINFFSCPIVAGMNDVRNVSKAPAFNECFFVK